MTELHVEASVRVALLASAPDVMARLEPAAEWCGYQLALTGSTVREGIGRDFDFVMFPTRVYPWAVGGEEVAERLRQAGMNVLLCERGEGLACRRYGIVGTFDGYAVDVTVLEPTWH